MEMTTSDFLSLLWDPLFLLGTAVILVLLNYLMWELLHSHPVGERISHSLWGHMQPPILPKMLAKLWPVIGWVRSRVRDLESTQHTQGTTMRLSPSTEASAPQVRWHSIRQILCDDPACVTCEHATYEARRCTDAVRRPGNREPADLKPSLPGRKTYQRFTRSVSTPAPPSAPFDLSSTRPILSSSLGPPGIKKDQRPPSEEPAALDWDERSHSSHQGGMEAVASSSSTCIASRFTWTKSSSGLSELSVGSLILSRSVSQLQITRTDQEDNLESSWTESKASSEHQMGPVPRKRPYSQTPLPRTAARSPARPRGDQATELTTASVPFLDNSVIASLESHVLVKRVQHYLGLPATLLRSLRSFMLSAPDLTLQRRRPREFGVATRPQALHFVDSGTRKKLELHLKRMVHQRHWQLPQRIQGALGQMKPPLQPREKKPSSAGRKQGPGVTGPVKGRRSSQSVSARLPAAAGVLDSKTTLASQAELQSHLVKKSLEIRLDTFPTIVGHSQKMMSRSRAPRLPKSILLGQSCPQLRNKLCLVLRSKADVVDMNIKCKYIHFLWGIPTVYLQSLNKMAPRAPALPACPAWVQATVEFVSVEPPFVKIWDLEYHVLRKRLQHQWGLPSLVLRSVKQFLVPLPPLPTCARPVLSSCLEVKISVGDTLFLLSRLEIKEKLELHVKTKIIERRWGLPRRALDSLRVFIPIAPPLVKGPKENEKTFTVPQGEKLAKRKPSTRALRTSKKMMVSSGKALQRHLSKKVLEVRLGAIVPMAQRSQAAVRWVQKKHPLPKAIPPGLKPLAPRPQELLFVDPSVLGNLQLNIIHKGLMYKWGLLTLYQTSLARLVQDVRPPAAVVLSPSKLTEPKFTAVQTLFVSGRNRELLEWHVQRKTLQHTWGLPGLIQRSLRYLRAAAPSFGPRKRRHTEVAVSLTEPTFLNDTVRRQLERNVQKRILNQQWQLPRRVLASLKLLKPSWKVDAFSQKPAGFPFAGSGGKLSRKTGYPPTAANTDALCPGCYMKKTGSAAPQRSQGFPGLGSTNMKKIELHWTKKCVEVQLEVFPAVIKRSRKYTTLMSSLSLPKLIPPGRKPLQPRRCSLSFVSQEDAGRMEVAMRVNHLMSLWGLGVRYVEGLHAMIPTAPVQSLGRRRKAALEFSEGRVLFLDGPAREALELHVRRKRLQHEWGLPVVIRRSIKALVQGSPLATAFRTTTTEVQTLQRDPAFLTQGACSRLEHHLQRLKLQRQWGLPHRVLKSLHMLMLETEPRLTERMMRPLTRSFSTESASRRRGRPRARGATDSNDKEPRETLGVAFCPTCQGRPFKGTGAKMLQQHLAKKSVEVHLGIFPAVPRLSWRRASLSSKKPLPKLIPPGHKVLEPRHASFPFLRTEEMERVEVALRCHRLASLWGLGAHYVEAFAAMAPRLPHHPVKSRRAAFGLPAGKPPAFQGLDSTTLEMHIRKKRMQHEWGLPALALKSLKGFMQGVPTLLRLSKTVIDTYVLPQGLSFLPQATRSRLEFHVQRMKLQRAWGLPRRILASLKAFIPSASWQMSPLTLHYREERSALAGSCPGETQRSFRKDEATKCISSKHKAMEDHFRRKYLEMRLEAFPHLVSESQAAARGWGKIHLPKWVQAGQKLPTSRAVSLSFLLPATMDQLEVNMKHKHLAFLWGLPRQHMAPLSMFALRGRPLLQSHCKKISFQEAKTPFCHQKARERLEHHMQKKRLHHQWGVPITIQRSLRAWAPVPSTSGCPRRITCKEVKVLVADTPFMSAFVQKELETSLKKMVIRGQWGLPKRLQAYLRAFSSTPPGGRELQKEEAADGDIMAHLPDEKRTHLITRPRQVTSIGRVSQQAPLETPDLPILGLFRSSKIRALENHLKKKSLEIKFQLPVVGGGTIKRARLPKCPPLSPVMKPRGAVLFVEPEALLKLTLNIKHKYLMYLWGLPNLHTESLKKMFGAVPKLPPKMTHLGKEATWKGRGATRPGKWTQKPEDFGSKLFQSPTAKPSFLTGKALDLLEVHVRHKKLQHEWGLPLTIQKSLRSFAPFPSEARRSTPSSEQPAVRPCCITVSVTPQSLLFLDPATTRHLEEHLKSRTASHRWGIPKMVQQSLKMFLPPASLTRKSKGETQTLLCQCDTIPLPAARRQAGGLPGRFTSRGISRRKDLAQDSGTQQRLHRPVRKPAGLSPEEMHKDKTPRHGRKTPERKTSHAATFLTTQTWDLLEFHIRRKRIQHEWGLPSIVQKSLHAFAPRAPDARASMKPRAGAYMAAKNQGAERTATDHTPRSIAEVSVPFQALVFLDPNVKSRLEAHVRSRTASHRWGLPQLVQDSLRAFLPPKLGSEKLGSRSHQQAKPHFSPEGKKSPGLHRVRNRTPERQTSMQQQGRRVAMVSPGEKSMTLVSPELELSFLPEDVLNRLAFHIQHKKIQHAWGLPSVAMHSLQAFAPFPTEAEKNMKHTGKITTEKRPWVRGEVRVVTPNLSFLSPDTVLRLDAHLSNIVAKHRWGLPALVQHSVKAFLPPPPSSPSKEARAHPLSAQPRKSFHVAATTTGHHDVSKREAVLRTVSSSPVFLTAEARDILEFHMQRKKVQHLWGLPSTVLKSLHAFAPFPREPAKHPHDAAKTLIKRRPWDTEVHVPTQSLSFLDAETRDRLEAHVRSRTAEHRWGLPKLVQDSLRALLPFTSLSHAGEMSRQPPLHRRSVSSQAPVIQPQIATERLPGRRETWKELQKEKPRATSTASSAVPGAVSLRTKLPFLTDGNQDSLEFHIQRKKIQHLWGLPSTVLKSLTAFAPFPHEPAKAAVTLVKRRLRGTEVHVSTQSLSFLDAETRDRLEAHVRSRTAEHRWGLPKLVQDSLRALLPSMSLSHAGEMSRQPQLHRRSASPQAPVIQPQIATERLPGRRETWKELQKEKRRATSTASSAVPGAVSLTAKLPFLTDGNQDSLEFHIQRKKIQHLWGLPSTVLKSLTAFAPFPHEPAKAAVTLVKRRPRGTEVHVSTQSLSFLDAETRDHLEAHVTSRTAEHRWGLPKLVQDSLRALLPSMSLSHAGETSRQSPLHRRSASPQTPVIQPQIATERLPGRRETSKELEKEKPRAISTASSAVPGAVSLRAKLPFLTDGNQDALEFHIQRKKMQHEWGLPLTVQRSVHAFAPVPPELHQGGPPTGGGRTAVEGARGGVGEMGVGTKKPWTIGTVNTVVPSLRFLDPHTKENLEAHLRNLTIEHRWGLPMLVHQSMRAFIPLPSHLDDTEMDAQESPSAYSHGKTFTASEDQFPIEATKEASSEDQHMEQYGGTDSCSATEEPLFYSGTKPEHARAMSGEYGSWKAGRELPQRSMLQNRPPLKKATQRQRSMIFHPRRDPRNLSLSSSTPGPKKYRYNASSWSTNLPRARYSSGRTPIGRVPRSSKTTLRNRRGMPQDMEPGFQRMEEVSHPRPGLKERQAPCISYPGWELGNSQKEPCGCYLRAHRDDSASSLLSDTEQRWDKAEEIEADSSEYSDLRDTDLSLEEKPAAGIHQEREFPSARTMPEIVDNAAQEAGSAQPHRQTNRVYQEKTNSGLPKRQSRLSRNREKKKVQAHLPRHQPSVRALRRWSSKDLCEACQRNQKPPPLPEGSNDPTSKAPLSPRNSGGFDQHGPPAPPKQGSLERKEGTESHLEDSLQATTDAKETERKTEGRTVSLSKEAHPLLTGAISQFSTEREWERVGDRDTKGKDSQQRNDLRREDRGSSRSIRQLPKMETSLKAHGSLKLARSPGAAQSQPSPRSLVLRKEGPAVVKAEKTRVLGPDSEGRRAIVRMQTVRVTGPKGSNNQGVTETEEGMLRWRKEPSQKGHPPGTLVRHGSSRPSRMSRGNGHLEREALKIAQDISKGVWDERQHARFVQGVLDKNVDRKLSLLGTIVERKLFLQQGFRFWVRSRETENESRRRTKKGPDVSQPPSFQGARTAEVRWVEVKCGDSLGGAELPAPHRTLPVGPQHQQARKMGSLTLQKYPQRASHRREKEVTRSRSRSRERKK